METTLVSFINKQGDTLRFNKSSKFLVQAKNQTN